MRTLVMTGGTRGLGRAVVGRILARPDWRIIVLARGTNPWSDLSPAIANRVDFVTADLADLHSVQRACRDVFGKLAGSDITALALNAGMQSARKDPVSADGFELHFAVNHPFRGIRIFALEQSVEQKLNRIKRFAVATDQAIRFFGVNLECRTSAFVFCFLNLNNKTEVPEHRVEQLLRIQFGAGIRAHDYRPFPFRFAA